MNIIILYFLNCIIKFSYIYSLYLYSFIWIYSFKYVFCINLLHKLYRNYFINYNAKPWRISCEKEMADNCTITASANSSYIFA